MKILGIPLLLILTLSTISGTVGASFAQIPDQAQQKIDEHKQQNMTKNEQVLASLDNFGVEVSKFVRDAMNQFRQQRAETITQIKQCREDMMNAVPSNRTQVKQDCRTNLDEIRNSYKDIRTLFQDTFKEFRQSIKVLRDDVNGKQVSDSDRQTAIDNITEKAKSNQTQMQHGPKGMDIEQFREKMRSFHNGP